MWARVKGRDRERAAAAAVQGGVHVSSWRHPAPRRHHVQDGAYRVLYSITEPLLPLLRRLMPGLILTTGQIGRAMLTAARQGAPKRVLESRDISALAPIA